MKPCPKEEVRNPNALLSAFAVLSLVLLPACTTNDPDVLAPLEEGPFAPGVDTSQAATVDAITVGNRLMAAGENELALEAFFRAAAEEGLTAEVLTSIGSANLNLGRLDQAEAQLRDAIEQDENYATAWNNLGVVLMEKGEYGEASRVFRTAFALDNGASDEIRSNLSLSLAKMEDARYSPGNKQQDDFDLVWQGTGSYLLVAPE